MIFVTLGSQKFPFNRILVELDRLKEEGKIDEDIFAQIGYSTYQPKNLMNDCNLVICHGGTGAIITALKNNKKVIAIPRLSKYREHVDDHQKQIVEEFTNCNLIKSIEEVDDLENSINNIKMENFDRYESNTKIIIDDIDNYIRGEL